ncbi:hypothetical protein [Burkholderia sp. AU28863]|uniref:hypothetical protein n=1 Tax=Burkholderia sp. AU28863 TaxID=2015352 RepID=UPI00211B28C0|nr:hypothetical protein [Burkholderia sp. AU28863]
MLLACIAAFFIYALHAPAALPHDATGAMLRSASTYLVLATALFACQLAAAFELVTLIRRMLAMLDATADTAGRIVAASSRVSHTQLAELETRLDAIKVLATDADAASHNALLQHVDALFRFVEDLQAAERQAPAIRTFPR